MAESLRKGITSDDEPGNKSEMEYQIIFVEHLQDHINGLLSKIDNRSLSKIELKKIKTQLKLQKTKSQQVLLLLQVMSKIRGELAYARFNYEKALKLGTKIEEAERRLVWLESRLQQLLFLSRSLCHVDYPVRGMMDGMKISESDLSPDLIKRLSSEQKERIFSQNINHESEGNSELEIATKENFEAEIERLVQPEVNHDDDDDEKAPESRQPINQSVKQRSEAETKDKVTDYWTSDHHRFEWVNFIQSLNPLSWHSLAISYPDSFLKKGENSFCNMPWNANEDKLGEADFDRKSFEKLQNKLATLYQSVEDAAVNSVDMKIDQQQTFHSNEISPKRQTLKNKQTASDERINEQQQQQLLPPIKSPGLGFYGERCSKLFSRPVSVVLPVIKQDRKNQFPRSPEVWCDINKLNKPKNVSYIRKPRQTPNDVPKLSMKSSQREYTPKKKEGRTVSMRTAASKIKALTRFRTNLMNMRGGGRDGLKWKRIQDLLSERGIASKNPEIVLDSLRCLTELGSQEPLIFKSVRNKIAAEKDVAILYEASKCLITLGCWDISAVKTFIKGLEKGNDDLRLDILDTICKADNSHFVNKDNAEISKLIRLLIKLIACEDERISFGAALSLGHLCVYSFEAKKLLIYKLQDPSFSIRDKALKSLVRQMNCRDDLIINTLLHQISNANNWKHRVNAANLLLFIGVKDATLNYPDKIFDTLEKLLWNHPNSDLRSKIADVINEFGMRPRAMFLVHKRLDDLDESLRSNAIIMLSTLRMKTEKELKILLDILELDSSVQVRIQVVKAFSILKWNDARIIKCLQEKEKGEGPIAQ
eukprot:gene9085-10055_t